jgi:hypothetical protein
MAIFNELCNNLNYYATEMPDDSSSRMEGQRLVSSRLRSVDWQELIVLQ